MKHYALTSADISPRFTVVVLTYSRDDVLKDVLGTLWNHVSHRDDYELILVDNNIEPNQRELFVGRFRGAQILTERRNKGVFARNDGIAAAQGEYIILLDDDVFVETPDFFDRFARLFKADPQLGSITVRKHVRGETGPRVDLIPHTRKDVDLDRPFPTFRFVGGCVAFRAAALEQVGGFSPDFFYGLEEIELSYSIIEGGWRILYSPEIVVEELEHPGGRRPTAVAQTERLRNKYIMSWLHMPFPAILANYALFTPYLAWRARGQVHLGAAIGGFLSWLRRKDRARRKPLSREAIAYIRSCGGAIWR